MAITNKEIINNQLKRINEKLSSNIETKWNKGRAILANTPFPVDFTARKPEQLIEYLAGMEEAIDYFTKQKK